MDFWRDTDAEFKQIRDATREELIAYLEKRPHAIEVLARVLDYLHAVRVETRMIRDLIAEETDPGYRHAIQQLKQCGDEILRRRNAA